MSKQVFISHASQDAVLAASVCQGLERQGLRCWIAPRDIPAGQPWGASIVQGLDACPVMVLVLTQRANESRHVVREVERADGKLARIITVRTDNLVLNPSLEYFLSADHWFDAVSKPLAAQLPALVAEVRILLALPRGAAKSVVLAAPGSVPPAPPSERELLKSFDDAAPDDWDRSSGGSPVGRFFRGLFADR